MLYRICRLAQDFTSPNNKEKTDFKKAGYSHQLTVWYWHKDEIVINGTKQKAQRQFRVPRDTLSLINEARIYNGEKTISLTSGAGKSGQPLVKE